MILRMKSPLPEMTVFEWASIVVPVILLIVIGCLTAFCLVLGLMRGLI